MTKRSLFTLALLIFTSIVNAQSVPWSWAKQIVGNNSSYGRDVINDNLGNIYVCGGFSDSARFDTIQFYNYLQAGFIVKYDSVGSLQWVKKIDCNNGCSAEQVMVDAQNNIYISGSFTGTLNVDTFILQTAAFNQTNYFVLKLNSAGNVLWARQPNATGSCIGAMNMDHYGNIFLYGSTGSKVDFGNGLSVSQAGLMFIIKYDSNGNPIQLITLSSLVPGSINISSDSKIFVTGTFYYSTIVGGDTLSPTDAYDDNLFICYDSTGNVIWYRQTTNNYGDSPPRATIDNFSNLYVYGVISDTTNFWGTILYPSFANGFTDYIIKMDSSGQIKWTLTNLPVSNLGRMRINDMQYQNDFLYAIGYTFNFGESTFSNLSIRSNSSEYNTAILKFDSSGMGIWSSIDTSNHNRNSPYAMFIDPNENISICGSFKDAVQFGNNLLYANSVNGMMFVARSSKITTAVEKSPIASNQPINIFPNPSNENFYLESSENIYRVEIFDSSGRMIQKINFEHTKNCNLKLESPGIYFVKIVSDKNIFSKKIIVVK